MSTDRTKNREFKLESEYSPTGDQPGAIEQLVRNINDGCRHQTLLGVTGSGKTFTMANVIARLNRPTMILAHNKTLAAQLYGEMKSFSSSRAPGRFCGLFFGRFLPRRDPLLMETWREAVAERLTRKGGAG